MKKAILWVLILGLLGGGGYAGYRFWYLPRTQGEGGGRVSSADADAVHVDSVSMLAEVNGGGMTDRYGGETVAQATLAVKKDEDRKVKEVFVKKGDVVKEGAKLFVYDTTSDEDEITQGEIDVEKSQNDIEQAKRQIENLEKLQRQATTEEDRLSYQTQILTEQSEVKRLEYEIQSKEREIEQHREKIKDADVTAEMGGIIQQINNSDNSDSFYGYGSGDDNSFITILATGDFRIEAKVNEQNIQNIYEGMEMIVFSRVDSGKFWRGTISEINTEQKADANSNSYGWYGDSGAESSTYKFYVELEDSSGLMLGQHVYLEQYIGQDKEREGLWMMQEFFSEEDGTWYAWIADSSNHLKKQEVTIGERDEETGMVQIAEGVTTEDYIAFPMPGITEGAPVVYNDLPVEGETESLDGLDDISYVGEDGVFLDDEEMGFGLDEDMSEMDDFLDDEDDAGYWNENGEYIDEEDSTDADWDEEDELIWEDYDENELSGAEDDEEFYDADAEDEEFYDADAEDDEFYDADAEEFYDADAEDDEFYDADAEDDEDI